MAGSFTTLACLLLMAAAAPSAQLPFVAAANMSSTGSSMVSPSVVASYHFGSGGAGLLRLNALVLLRGRPGWYAQTGGSSSGGGSASGSNSWNSVSRYGGIEVSLRAEFDRSLLFVQGRGVDLREGNVILVDSIDESSGPVFLDSLRIEAQVPNASGPDALLPIINAAPELKAFLRCNVASPFGTNRVTDLCAKVTR